MSEIINIAEVKEQVFLAKSVLDSKGLLDFTSNLHFYQGELFAGNDKTIFISPVSLKSNFSVNGDDFCRIVDGIKDEAELKVSRSEISLTAKNITANLSLYKPDQVLTWITTSGINPKDITNWTVLPTDFWIGVDWCKFSVSKDMSARALTCLYFEGNKIYSTDNQRLSRYIMQSEMSESLFLPKETVPILLKFPDLTEYALIRPKDSKNLSWILFRSNTTNMVVGSRLVVGKFPKIEPFFDKEGELIKFPEDFKEIISRAAKFAEGLIEETKTITISISEGELVCTVVKPTGKLEQKTKCEYDKNLSFQTIPALLEQILNKSNEVSLFDKFMSFKVDRFSHVLIII